MKSVLFLICVIAGTLVLTSAQCDYNRIISCSNGVTNGISQAQGSVEKICKLYNDFRNCLNRISGCEDIQKTLDSVSASYKEQLSVCSATSTAGNILLCLIPVLAFFFFRE